MNLKDLKISKIQIITVAILLLGIIVAVILVQRQQIFRSKATNEIYNAFEVKNSSGQTLPYSDTPGIRTYQTDDLYININIKDINALVEP